MLVACFSVCLVALAQPVLVAAVTLPYVVNSEGFTLTITYYSITGPNTVALVGSIENDGSQTVELISLTGTVSIAGVDVGSGSLDQQYVTLIGGMTVPASATITTRFNIYWALGSGFVALDDGSKISFYYDTTPVTVTVTAFVCSLQGSQCVPWSLPIIFSQTSSIADL